MELNDKIFQLLNFNDGFYIECGANDGVKQSNTLRLENEKNWNGILIEPSINAFEACKLNRGNLNIFENCLLSSFENENKEIDGDFDGSLMSSINGERLTRNSNYKVLSKTLTTILKSNNINKVDFFSLDVEGHEYEVLNGLDFDYCSPTWIVIEIYTKDLEKIMDFMGEKNYKLIENLTNFNHKDNPHWDGTHNDYLFKING
jgi:FkbM family methyltransferase